MCCTSSHNPAGCRRTPRTHAQRDRRHRGCACESTRAASNAASRRRICRSSGICTRRFCDALYHECACVCLDCSSTRIPCFSPSTRRFYFLQPSNGHWNGFFDFLKITPISGIPRFGRIGLQHRQRALHLLLLANNLQITRSTQPHGLSGCHQDLHRQVPHQLSG